MRTVKDLNFLPEYLTSKQKRVKKEFAKLTLIIIIVAIILSIIFIPKLVYSYYESQFEAVTSELTKYSGVKKDLEEYSKLVKIEKTKKDILEKIEKNQVEMTELINDIEQATPYNVQLNSYSISGDSMAVSLTIHSPMDIVKTIRNYQDLGRFNSININTFPIVDRTEKINISLQLK